MKEIIERIVRMEGYFDAIRANPGAVRTDPEAARMYAELLDYYENGLWLADFQRDERGELPAGLKRGVLSEDGVYNLITEVEPLCE
ncbi:MAG: DUF4298 domain-containing protein [Clostridia bacterium]|nr:DUF4298 domain-containing protein [Clostridia bacterium]